MQFTIGDSSNYGGIAANAEMIVDKNGNKTYRDEASGFEYIDTPDGFRFMKKNGEYKLIAYLGAEDAVTLPKGINGNSYIVYKMRGVHNVIIPSGVTSIDELAFYYCSSLTSITIPDSVTSISSSAFFGCSSLTSITIPDSVTSIGDCAFCDCSSLTSVTIGNGVTSIGGDAFAGCSSLTSITIPDSVTSIGWDAFSGCAKLTSATIGKGVSYLGTGAFAACPINSFVLSDQNTNFIAQGGVLYDKDMTAIKYVFPETTTVNIPATVTDIRNAFEGNTKITSVFFAEDSKLTSIDYDAFSGCSSLASVTIPDSVTSIGMYAFRDCSSLTSITIPNRATLSNLHPQNNYSTF